MASHGSASRTFRAVSDYAIRTPSRWEKAVAVVLAVVLPLAVWDQRGAAVGVVAFVVWGGMLLFTAFGHGRVQVWTGRHPAIDAAFIVPLTFLALAYLTSLPLAACAAIGVGAGLIFVPIVVWGRRRASV